MAVRATAPAIPFPVAGETQVGLDATWVSAWTEVTGGQRLFKRPIKNNPAALTLNRGYLIPAGDIALVFPNGDGDDAYALRLARGALAGGFWFQLHSADPGTANDNALAVARVFVAAATWTLA